MLIWLLNLVFNLANFVLDVMLFVLPVFIVAKIAVPENKYVLLAAKYADIVLAPIRRWLKKIFPQASEWSFDFSPVALWVLILLAQWLLRLLRGLLI